MSSKPFYSKLFGKDILPNDPEWRAKAEAELLFRLFDMDERACTCFECKRIREEFYEKAKQMLLKDRKIRIIDSLT